MTQIEVIILSLLYDKDYYGYEMELIIEQRHMREWTNIGFSSIYNSLNKLEKKDLVNSRYEKEYGSPRRKVYSIKNETKELLKKNIMKMLSEVSFDSSQFDVGMAFSYILSEEELLKALVEHKGNLIKRREHVIKRYNQHPTAYKRPYIRALFQRPIELINTEILWVEELIEENFKNTNKGDV